MITFVSLDVIAVSTYFRDRCIPTNAQLGTFDTRDSNIAHQAWYACFGGDRDVHVFRLSSLCGHTIFGEYLETIGRDSI